MSTIGNKAAAQHVSLQKQTITGNGGTSYTLQQSVGSSLDIAVFINNTRQEPVTAYSASGTALVMTGAVNASDHFYVLFLTKAITTTSLPVDVVGTSNLAADAVSTAKIANDAITNAKIGAGAVDATEIASSLNLSSKTLTMPQKFNGLQHITTVNPVGTNAFVQDLSSYEQVMVFFNNVEGSSSGANININFGTASDGTTNGTVMNYIYHDFFVNDTTNMVGYNGATTQAILIDNHWGNVAAGTNGYFLIGGIGTGNTTNKRISYSGMMMKQSPANQEVEVIGGQMQNSSNKYTHARISISSGNFAGSTRFTFFGVNHYNV